MLNEQTWHLIAARTAQTCGSTAIAQRHRREAASSNNLPHDEQGRDAKVVGTMNGLNNYDAALDDWLRRFIIYVRDHSSTDRDATLHLQR